MIVEIIKGLKYFYAMVIVVFVAFSVAQINLFRARPSVSGAHAIAPLGGFPKSTPQGVSPLPLPLSGARSWVGTHVLTSTYSMAM